MGRKKEHVPKNIERYTIQMDENVYNAIKKAAIGLKKKTKKKAKGNAEDVKTYELMNKVVLLGIALWVKTQRNQELKSVLKKSHFTKALKMATQVP